MPQGHAHRASSVQCVGPDPPVGVALPVAPRPGLLQEFATVIAGMWPDPVENEANIQWGRDYYDATAPHSEAGGYVNFMAGDDQDRIKTNYRGNYDRLVDVKRQYDPDNLFHLNQNIKP
jgi:FAD/FMN-containing dehydrogenase